MTFDFETIRAFLFAQKGTYKERITRLNIFEMLWYAEEYEQVYDMVIYYGGKIISA